MRFSKYDDLNVVSNDLSDFHGFTLTGIVGNEMYFLSPFLAHYRKLGVKRFIFIDDQSVDGTREYLSKQDDVMVLGSKWRYGDSVNIPNLVKGKLKHRRMAYAWRMLLLNKFGCGEWSLHVDADEFVCLPESKRFPDIALELEKSRAEAVWGVMLDMYPASINDLRTQIDEPVFDPNKSWYFDGQEHLRVRPRKTPKTIYPGVRARLMAQFGLNRRISMTKSIAYRVSNSFVPGYNLIRKPVLLKWDEDKVLLDDHNIDFHGSPKHLLPIMHFKFTGNLYQRVTNAIQNGSHFNASIEYKDMQRLLKKMEQEDTTFLYARSTIAAGFNGFQRTGNAVGFI